MRPPMSLINDTNETALRAVDAAAIAALFGYFINLLPQATLLVTFLWAIFRAWAEWENIKLKREQRKNLQFRRRKDD